MLGSGLSALGDELDDKVAIPFSELKGFPGGGVSGHGRDLLIGTMGGKRVAILTGREHYYEHGNPAAMRPALETMAELGAKTLLLTNSAGSLDERIRPGDLMLLSDHINYAGMNPLIGEPTDRRFVNMVDCYDPDSARQGQGAGRAARYPPRTRASISGIPAPASKRSPKSRWPFAWAPMPSACRRHPKSSSGVSSG